MWKVCARRQYREATQTPSRQPKAYRCSCRISCRPFALRCLGTLCVADVACAHNRSGSGAKSTISSWPRVCLVLVVFLRTEHVTVLVLSSDAIPNVARDAQKDDDVVFVGEVFRLDATDDTEPLASMYVDGYSQQLGPQRRQGEGFRRGLASEESQACHTGCQLHQERFGIRKGIKKNQYRSQPTVEVDQSIADFQCLFVCELQDVVLLTGKGVGAPD